MPMAPSSWPGRACLFLWVRSSSDSFSPSFGLNLRQGEIMRGTGNMPLNGVHERFRVSCLLKAASVADEWGATHVISLIDPALGQEHAPVIRGAEHIVARLRDQETAELTGHF